MPKEYGQACPIAKSLEIIGDRWTLLIVRDLMRGKTKFQELLDVLPGIASNVLSERLKHLEDHGVVTRRFYSEHPPRAEYNLTKKGTDLGHVMGALAYWGSQHVFTDASLVDSECGHEVKPGFYCPECDHRVPGRRVRPVSKSKAARK